MQKVVKLRLRQALGKWVLASSWSVNSLLENFNNLSTFSSIHEHLWTIQFCRMLIYRRFFFDRILTGENSRSSSFVNRRKIVQLFSYKTIYQNLDRHLFPQNRFNSAKPWSLSLTRMHVFCSKLMFSRSWKTNFLVAPKWMMKWNVQSFKDLQR